MEKVTYSSNFLFWQRNKKQCLTKKGLICLCKVQTNIVFDIYCHSMFSGSLLLKPQQRKNYQYAQMAGRFKSSLFFTNREKPWFVLRLILVKFLCNNQNLSIFSHLSDKAISITFWYSILQCCGVFNK